MSYLNPSLQSIRLGIDLSPLDRLRDRRLPRNGPDRLEMALAAQDAGADAIIIDLSEALASNVPAEHARAAASVLALQRALSIEIELTLPDTESAFAFALQVAPSAARFIGNREGFADPDDASHLTSALPASSAERIRSGALRQIVVVAGPGQQHVAAAHTAGAREIEISAVEFGLASTAGAQDLALQALRDATRAAVQYGMRVQIAGGLDHRNIGTVAALPDIDQINVGYAVAVRALTLGWHAAVRELKAAIVAARAPAGRLA